LVACSACNNGNIKVDDIVRYKDVCSTFGVPFTGAPEGSSGPAQPTTPNNPTDASTEPQINNNIPNYSNSSNSLSSYIILGVVVGIPVLIIFSIFVYKCCFKRRRSLKIKNVNDKSLSQVDLTDDSSIISRLQAYQQQHSQHSQTQSIENDDLTEISIENDRINNNDIQQQQYKFRKNY
jgi:hypothetical protein